MDKIYVGTYAKYNSGSLGGQWVDLSDFSDKDEFYEYITDLHKDEADPEFMFQDLDDNSGFLRKFAGESSIDEKYFELMDEIQDWDEDRIEAYAAFVDLFEDDDINNFEEKFIMSSGEGSNYEAVKELAYHMEDMGYSKDKSYYYASDTTRRVAASDEHSRVTSELQYDTERGDFSNLEGVDEDSSQDEIDAAIEEKADEEYDRWYEGLNDPESFLIDEEGLYSDISEVSFLSYDYQRWGESLTSSDVAQSGSHFFWNN